MYSVLHKPQLLLIITTATRPFLMVWNPPRALIVFHVHFNANYAVMQLRKITFCRYGWTRTTDLLCIRQML